MGGLDGYISLRLELVMNMDSNFGTGDWKWNRDGNTHKEKQLLRLWISVANSEYLKLGPLGADWWWMNGQYGYDSKAVWRARTEERARKSSKRCLI